MRDRGREPSECSTRHLHRGAGTVDDILRGEPVELHLRSEREAMADDRMQHALHVVGRDEGTALQKRSPAGGCASCA